MFHACVSQAVLKLHSPYRWDFHNCHDCQRKYFKKNKAAFSDNISRAPFGGNGQAAAFDFM
ncbi:hypothetical protein B5E77_00365 [Lachnoclostridium sp. An131]|nr:hypothetical protein B5E77_00365 [Lachnoclostridium sp. An131]